MSKPINRNTSWYLDPQPFIDRLNEWLARQADRGDQEINATDFIATHMGVTVDWIYKFRRGGYQTIHFDRADALMCAMNIAHEWITEPVFFEMYRSVDFGKLDEAKPCDRVAPVRLGRQGPRSFDHDEARRLHETGMGYAKIGTALGVSRRAIQSAILRAKAA